MRGCKDQDSRVQWREDHPYEDIYDDDGPSSEKNSDIKDVPLKKNKAYQKHSGNKS